MSQSSESVRAAGALARRGRSRCGSRPPILTPSAATASFPRRWPSTIPASPTSSPCPPSAGCRQNSDGVRGTRLAANWAKTIFPNLALSVGVGPTWLHARRLRLGRRSTPKLKYQFLCIPQLEFMASVGFDVSWGGSATGAQIGAPNMYSPVLDVGLGFGALPTSMNYLRPFAITGGTQHDDAGTGDVGRRQCSRRRSTGASRCNTACPTYNSHVGEIDNDLPEASHSDRRIRLLHADRQRRGRDLGDDRNDPTRRRLHGGQMAARRRSRDPGQWSERSRRRRGGQPRSLPRRYLPRLASANQSSRKPCPCSQELDNDTHFDHDFAACARVGLRDDRAFAHAQLEKATPAVGGTVASASEIRLEFSEGVEPKFSKVSVTGPGGAVPLGAAKTESGQSGCADRADLQTPVRRRLQSALAGRVGRHASHPGNVRIHREAMTGCLRRLAATKGRP